MARATWHAGAVADSDAVRSARKRAHQRGDHHLCRHPPEHPARSLTVLPVPAAVELVPRDELVRLAVALTAAYEADPANANLARELRNTLLAIPAPDPDEDDPLLAIRRRYSERMGGYQSGR